MCVSALHLHGCDEVCRVERNPRRSCRKWTSSPVRRSLLPLALEPAADRGVLLARLSYGGPVSLAAGGPVIRRSRYREQ